MQNKKFSQQLLEAVLNANRKIFICGFLRTVTGALLYTSVLPTSVQMLSVLESASDLTHVHHTQVQQWTRTSSNYVVLMWTCLRSSKIFTRSRASVLLWVCLNSVWETAVYFIWSLKDHYCVFMKSTVAVQIRIVLNDLNFLLFIFFMNPPCGRKICGLINCGLIFVIDPEIRNIQSAKLLKRIN